MERALSKPNVVRCHSLRSLPVRLRLPFLNIPHLISLDRPGEPTTVVNKCHRSWEYIASIYVINGKEAADMD